MNISSGPKIPKGNFGSKLIYTKEKVRKLRGEGSSKKIQQNVDFFLLKDSNLNYYCRSGWQIYFLSNTLYNDTLY